jgi:sRNA-binding carbon storage regulator CsrA
VHREEIYEQVRQENIAAVASAKDAKEALGAKKADETPQG